MNQQNIDFQNIIEKANSILIITHKGPDTDAFCSSLILLQTLRQIYPTKNIQVQAKQTPASNLPTMKDINIVEKIDNKEFDTLIVTDAGSIDLCIDENDEVITEGKNIIIVDHHDTILNQEDNILFINNNASSATEEIYTILKDIYKEEFKVTEEIAHLVQYGIVADTGRFLYDITTPNSLRICADMIEISPIDIEEFVYKNEKFPKEATLAIQEFLKTLTIERDMAYMYIDREAIEQSRELQKGASEGQAFIRDKFIRYIQGVHWGFIVKPDMNTENNWYISFRSTKGYQDVQVIAKELGGGGHMYAAGVTMKANSLEEVLNRILEVVRKHL
ncbi:MAG: DHH family phosphoesterase [Candidatus Dojkabacteria bacterium]|jgi:phosphoesterase RecJ-like protein